MRLVIPRRRFKRHLSSALILASLVLALAPGLSSANQVAPPSDLSATSSAAGVALSWRAAQPATVGGYWIYRNALLLDSVSGVNTTSYVDRTAAAGSAASYSVVSIDWYGTTSLPTNTVSVPAAGTAAAPPAAAAAPPATFIATPAPAPAAQPVAPAPTDPSPLPPLPAPRAKPVAPASPPPDPPITCDRYAAPGGSDGAPGTIDAPVATIDRLDAIVAPGQTGCLRGGTYGGTRTQQLVAHGGAPARPITLRSAPGESATLIGELVVTAAYVTVSHLAIDASNDLQTYFLGNAAYRGCKSYSQATSAGLEINASNVTFEYNDVFQSNPVLRDGSAIGVNWPRVHGQNGDVIRFNKIHDYGSCHQQDHGIYVDDVSDIRIYGNWIYNGLFGACVQLYPSASGANVYSNVCENTGLGIYIGTEPGTGASSNNTISRNVFANLPGAGIGTSSSEPGYGVASYWGGAVGSGNAFVDNVLFNSAGPGHASGIALSGTIERDPQFADPAYATSHSYAVAAGSPAASFGIWDGVTAP